MLFRNIAMRAKLRSRCCESWRKRTRTIDSALTGFQNQYDLADHVSTLSRCIHLLHTFDYRDHVCIVSELLSASVFDYLKENQYQPFPFNHIQDFARQLLGSVCCAFRCSSLGFYDVLTLPLAVLHKHELIHTDLKPENILLESTDSYTVPGKVRSSFSSSLSTF